MNLDEATRAYRDTVKLMHLYGAYSATSRAHGMVLQRLLSRLDSMDGIVAAEKQQIAADLFNRLALSRESDSVWRENLENLQVRLMELIEFTS